MARRRKPEPFWRAQTRSYYVQIGKKQHRLGGVEAEAWRRYHELIARPDDGAPEVEPSGPATLGTLYDYCTDMATRYHACAARQAALSAWAERGKL